MKHNTLIILSLFFFSSCSNMIANYYKQLDGPKKHRSRRVKRNKKYRSPISKSLLLNSRSQKVLLPPTKRLYVEQGKGGEPTTRRMNAQNFYENRNDANLWSDKDSVNLYTQSTTISSGDIVIINVLGDLKNDITEELKRAFPKRKRRIKKDKNKKETEEKPDTVAQNKADTNQAQKVYDRISSIVIDTVNDNYVTIRGRKELLYNNKKHSIEIHALINKQDISANNYIQSSDIIEKQIRIIY